MTFKTASELYFEAIKIAEKKHLNKLSSLYNNLCIMYKDDSEYYKNIVYLRIAKNLKE